MDALQTLIAAGLTLRTNGDLLIVTPASALTDSLRRVIRERKPELLASVLGAAALIESAMRACDRWCDDDAAREQMRRDCAATPEVERADMLNHFERTYPRESG